MRPLRIAVFDTVAMGHHASWLEPVTQALSSLGHVKLFLSEALAARTPNLKGDVELVSHDEVEPRHQLDLLAEIGRSDRIDHIFHLYAVKPVIREWLRRPPIGIPCSIVITHASALHYAAVYETPLSPSERLNAWYKEILVHRWRQRADAHSVFTMEEAAVARWSRRRGAGPYYFPEPPVPEGGHLQSAPRRGALVCGSIGPGKCLENVVRAFEGMPPGVELVLAGEVQPSYEPELRALTAQMIAGGAVVRDRLRWHSAEEMMATLSAARCLVDASLYHKGGSHTLVEAAAAGTPVVVHRRGQLGYTVRRYGLGLAVDCTNPSELRRAILELTEDEDSTAKFGAALAEFAALHSREHFRAALCAPFTPQRTAASQPVAATP